VIPWTKPSVKVEKGEIMDRKFPCGRCHSTYELSMILMYRPDNIPDAALNLPTK
jgi:predicted PP-loop superfamily ATPase